MMLVRISNPTMPVRDCLVDFKLVVRQSTVAVNSELGVEKVLAHAEQR
jgi:hypothetical protein